MEWVLPQNMVGLQGAEHQRQPQHSMGECPCLVGLVVDVVVE